MLRYGLAGVGRDFEGFAMLFFARSMVGCG
jgi:hypothetical protein